MTSMNEFISDAKSLEKSYRAVLAISTKVAEIGDLDKAYEHAERKLREHKQTVASAGNKAQEAKDRLEAIYEEIVAAKGEAADILVVAQTEAKKMVDEASHDVAEKHRHAQVTTDQAKAEVEDYHEHVRNDNEKHKERMVKNATEYAEATDRLTVLKDELAALQEKFGIK